MSTWKVGLITALLITVLVSASAFVSHWRGRLEEIQRQNAQRIEVLEDAAKVRQKAHAKAGSLRLETSTTATTANAFLAEPSPLDAGVP